MKRVNQPARSRFHSMGLCGRAEPREAGTEEWDEMVSQLWDAWPLRIEVCPCDLHFVEEQGLAQATIFHLGTGAHHLVGRRLAHDGRDNVVIGITIAPREHEAYAKLAMADPILARSYQVLLGDIYS
jgi:hypothetical protein